MAKVKSNAEIDLEIQKLKTQKVENHLRDEANKIKAIKCPNCGKKLGLKPKSFMKKDGKAITVECECETLVYVLVDYRDSPETENARIVVKSKGHAWETQRPATWKDKHALKWYNLQVEAIKEDKCTLPEETQKLIRAFDAALKQTATPTITESRKPEG
jgi:DNA-directed RNA polymerase subunit RPC12/RpoP